MTLSGCTRDQLSAAQRLRANGVQVKLCQGDMSGREYNAVGRMGVDYRGILHAKAMLAIDPGGGRAEFVIGSTNWTTGSRANQEMDVLIDLRSEKIAEVRRHFEAILAGGEHLDAAQSGEAWRARSLSPSVHRGWKKHGHNNQHRYY